MGGWVAVVHAIAEAQLVHLHVKLQLHRPGTPVLLRRLMAVFHDGLEGGHVAAGALIHGETASAWIQTAALLG